MCSQFTQRFPSVQAMLDLFKLLKSIRLEAVPHAKVMPYQPGATLIQIAGQTHLVEMQFSLVPHWSKEPRLKFATHNARLETAGEKPSFRDPFRRRHCVVPMSGFIEPIYVRDLAGNMVEFKPEAQKLLLAAGIWDEWISKKDGEVLQSFSVITSDPVPFVEQVGHDRSPVFLDEERAVEWLGNEGGEAALLTSFLSQSKIAPSLSAEVERPMKPGWEKRVAKS